MKTIRVVGQNEISRVIRRALADAGFGANGNDSLVVVADWQEVGVLFGYREQRDLPWILIEETHSGGVAVGPIFRPAGPGCFRCYIDRRRSNGGQECRPLRDASPAMISNIVRAIGTFADRISEGHSEQLEVTADGDLRSHVFLPVPSCERCWNLQTRYQGLSLTSLVSDRTGLVHDVREITNMGSLKAALVSGCRTDAFSDARALNLGMAVDETLEFARDRAIGESVERYCGSFTPADLPEARAHELDGPFLHTSHFADLQGHTDGCSSVRWVRATSLLNGKDIWVPASRVYVPYTHHNGELSLGVQSSVGLAAGRSIDEAIQHGLAEIVERDTCLRAWRYNLPVEEVTLRPIPLEGLYLTKIPNDSGLQVVAAFLEQRQAPLTSTGLAAGPSLAAAARHATLEAVLSRMWLEDWLVNSQGIYSDPPRNMVDHAGAHAVRSDLVASRGRWLHPNRKAETEMKAESWSEIIEKVPAASFVDLTTKDVEAAGVKVVRVLIPNLVTADDDALWPRLGGCATPHPFG